MAFRKTLSPDRLATFKSRVNELRLLTRLLRADEITRAAAVRELDRVQHDLRYLSQTPKGTDA